MSIDKCAHLLVVFTKKSGVWLKALPESTLELQFGYDVTVRVLGLYAPACKPLYYHCRHCDADVYPLCRHSLSWL